MYKMAGYRVMALAMPGKCALAAFALLLFLSFGCTGLAAGGEASKLATDTGVLTALTFAVAIIALSFMSGEFFSMPSLKAFSKAEMGELFVSVVILLLAMALVTSGGPFDLIAKGFADPRIPLNTTCQQWSSAHGTWQPAEQTWTDGNVAFGRADYFLGCRPKLDVTDPSSMVLVGVDGVVLRKLTLGYMSLMVTEMAVGFLSGLGTNIGILIWLEPPIRLDVGVLPWISMGLINDIHTLIVDLVGTLWSAFAAQKILLLFIEEAAIPVFLPFGLLLRAFPFSRKTGSTIVAVVFVAYFVYPITILINERIWMDITEPLENPNTPAAFTCAPVPATWTASCCPLEHACANDSECCSNNCRKNTTGDLVCKSQLTDFTEYQSSYSMCYGASQGQIETAIGTEATQYYDGLSNVYFTPDPILSPATKSEARLKEFGDMLGTKVSAAYGVGESLMFSNPRRVIVTAFAAVEMMVMEVAQYAMLALLFIVLEVVICLTLLKDFTLLIGGEPRVLGLTKLV